MPNAQLIQRHIDNLISQNEAIVDNWNLVSIRSYNSTRDISPQNRPLPASTQQQQQQQQQPTNSSQDESRQHRRLPLGLNTGRVQRERRTSQGAINQQPVQSEPPRRKRCSTSAILNPPINLVPILSAAGPSSRDSLLSGSNYTASSEPQTSQVREPNLNRLSFSSQVSAYSACESGPGSPKVAGAADEQRQSDATSANKFPIASSANASNAEVLKLIDQHRHLLLTMPPVGPETPLVPLQLESAIQNLSLKRKDDELNSYLQNGACFRHGAGNSHREENHINAPGGSPPPPSAPHQHQPHHPVHHQHHHHFQNINRLWDNDNNNSTEQQQNLIPARRDEQLVLAALLMERHRQSLAELENQAALIHHQQHMIEQQNQLSQFVANQSHQHQIRAEVAVTVAASASLPEHLLHNANAEPQQASAYLHYASPGTCAQSAPQATYDQISAAVERYRSAVEQANICDSHLLNNFLTKVMTNSSLAQAELDSHLHATASLQVPSEARHPAAPSHLVSTGVTGGGGGGGGGSGGRDANFGLERQADRLTHNLESATPLHRCDTCDIAFWTRDLLNYHLITQCSARAQQYQAGGGGADSLSRPGAGSPTFRRPLSFNFTGPNNFDRYLNNELYAATTPTSKEPKESRRLAFEAANLLSPSIQAYEHSKSASPPRQRYLSSLSSMPLGDSDCQPGIGTGVGAQKLANSSRCETSTTTTTTSILKQQLLTDSLQASLPEFHDQSLPFKKRKISEPNMKLNCE